MNRRFRRKFRVGLHTGGGERIKILRTAGVIAAALALVVILTVLWGLELGKKAEASRRAGEDISSDAGEDPGTPDGQPGAIPAAYDPSAVPVIEAAYKILSSRNKIPWSGDAETLKSEGVTALSLVLYHSKGQLNFNSKTAQAMGYQSPGDYTTVLTDATGPLGAAGIYTSGCFYVNYTSKSTPALRAIYRSYEAGLLAEAASAGFSELLLFGFEPNAAGAAEAGRLRGAVGELAGEFPLGIALPRASIEADILAAYAAVADFLAFDFTDAKDEEALLAAIEGAGGYIRSFNARVVIPLSLEAVKTKLGELGIKNWQIVPD